MKLEIGIININFIETNFYMKNLNNIELIEINGGGLACDFFSWLGEMAAVIEQFVDHDNQHGAHTHRAQDYVDNC